jgi:hypothetical protein
MKKKYITIIQWKDVGGGLRFEKGEVVAPDFMMAAEIVDRHAQKFPEGHVTCLEVEGVHDMTYVATGAQ